MMSGLRYNEEFSRDAPPGTACNLNKTKPLTSLKELNSQIFKRDRGGRKNHEARRHDRRGVLECIEFFYNPKRKHVTNAMLSPIGFKRQKK